MLKSIPLFINLILLAAYAAITSEPASTATSASSLTPVSPTSRSTQTATRTSSPTAPDSTSTPSFPTSSTTPHPDSVEQTREAEAFCYLDPRKALDDYLTFLYRGEYEKAARLFASPYPFEGTPITPEALEPSERLIVVADFLRSFCQGYGTCLKHKIVDGEILSDRSRLSEKFRILPEGDVMIFGVNFFYENGEIFESIPPAGIPRERHTLIGLVVVRLAGCYQNIDIPPMTP